MNRDRRQERALVAAAIAMVLLGAPSAGAQIEHRGFEPPELIQLSGHMGPAFPNETGGWNFKLGVRFSPTHYDYHIYELRVVSSGRLGEQILFAVEPYRPQFFLFGSKEQMAQLESATPADLVKITGWRRPGSRVLSITEVSVSPAQTPTPTDR